MRKLLFVVLFALVAVFLLLPTGQAGRATKGVDGASTEIRGIPKKDAVSSAFQSPQKKPSAAAQTNQTDEDIDDDPDLPPGMGGKIDKEAYLRARADYIDMLRGRIGDVPPDARDNAIRQMTAQEKAVRLKVKNGLM